LTRPVTTSPTLRRSKSSSRSRARSSSWAALWLTISRLRLRLTSRILTMICWPTKSIRLPEWVRATWELGKKPRRPMMLTIRPPLFCSRTSASTPSPELSFSAALAQIPSALATIGILQAVQAFVSNFDPWGRSTGMYLSFNSYQSLGGARHALWITYFLIIAVMALSMIVSLAIKNSKFGLGLSAIREDEDAAVVLGVNATMYKAIIYSVSAFLPAVAGALMFFKNGMIDPSIAFEYMLSLEGIVMLMLGGQGSVIGAALGGALYEKLRSYLLTNPVLSNFHLVIAGGLLLIVVLFAPGGLIGWVYRLVPRARKVIE